MEKQFRLKDEVKKYVNAFHKLEAKSEAQWATYGFTPEALEEVKEVEVAMQSTRTGSHWIDFTLYFGKCGQPKLVNEQLLAQHLEQAAKQFLNGGK